MRHLKSSFVANMEAAVKSQLKMVEDILAHDGVDELYISGEAALQYLEEHNARVGLPGATMKLMDCQGTAN